MKHVTDARLGREASAVPTKVKNSKEEVHELRTP